VASVRSAAISTFRARHVTRFESDDSIPCRPAMLFGETQCTRAMAPASCESD
jgi:hypothetical protein